MAQAVTSRTRFLAARFSEADAAKHEQAAAAAGVSVSDLIRGALDGAPPPRRTARPTVDQAELARLMGAIGRIGSNVNQLARVANSGSWPDSRALDEASADIRWMRDAVMRALGVTPPDPADRPPAGPVP